MAGLLDGGIAGIFASALGSLYLDGTLHRQTRAEDKGGTVSETFADVPIKGQVDSVTEAMRQAPGYTDRDVRLIVLAQGVDPDPTTDDQATLGGARYSIASVDIDAARSHFIMRGTPS